MAMDPYGFRQRQFMAPQFNASSFNISSGAGPWASQPDSGNTPFTGMEIQGPMRMPELPRPQIDIPEPPPVGWATPSNEHKPFTGMAVQGPLGQQAPMGKEEEEPDGKEFDMFEAMYNAPTPALEAYKRHIMSSPNRADYQPNKFDRIAAALTGVSQSMRQGGAAGYAASRGMIERPYQEALEGYQTQGQGLGQLAEIESTDMRNKMSYAKTMMEQSRLNQKETREGLRDLALNRLTDAQIRELEIKLKNEGKSIVTNEATGEKEIVGLDGSRQSLGKFLQTPEEKANTEVNIHGRKQGIEHGYNVSMAGVNFGNTLRGKGVDFANDAALADLAAVRDEQKALFEQPLKVQTAVDTARGTAPIEIDKAKQIRLFNQEHPIQATGTDKLLPYQTDRAYTSAVRQTILEFPGYSKFGGPDKQAAQVADPEGHKDFIAKVNKLYGDIKAAASPKPVSPAKSAEVPKPTPTPSPLNPAPNEDSALRAQAVAAIRERAKVDSTIQEDESTITQVMAMLRGK